MGAHSHLPSSVGVHALPALSAMQYMQPMEQLPSQSYLLPLLAFPAGRGRAGVLLRLCNEQGCTGRGCHAARPGHLGRVPVQHVLAEQRVRWVGEQAVWCERGSARKWVDVAMPLQGVALPTLMHGWLRHGVACRQAPAHIPCHVQAAAARCSSSLVLRLSQTARSHATTQCMAVQSRWRARLPCTQVDCGQPIAGLGGRRSSGCAA